LKIGHSSVRNAITLIRGFSKPSRGVGFTVSRGGNGIGFLGAGLSSIKRPSVVYQLADQLRQLGDIGGDAPRFVLGHEISRRSAPRFLLVVVHIRNRVTVLILHDEASVVVVFDGPGQREAACRYHFGRHSTPSIGSAIRSATDNSTGPSAMMVWDQILIGIMGAAGDAARRGRVGLAA
jgi:hypothetical protein